MNQSQNAYEHLDRPKVQGKCSCLLFFKLLPCWIFSLSLSLHILYSTFRSIQWWMAPFALHLSFTFEYPLCTKHYITMQLFSNFICIRFICLLHRIERIRTNWNIVLQLTFNRSENTFRFSCLPAKYGLVVAFEDRAIFYSFKCDAFWWWILWSQFVQ